MMGSYAWEAFPELGTPNFEAIARAWLEALRSNGRDMDDEITNARQGQATLLASIQTKADADHGHGEGGVVVTIVASEAALGTGATNGELKWTLDGGFKMFFWDASAGKWGIVAGRWATEPSPSTYTIETGTIVIINGQAKIYNGTAFTDLVDMSTYDALIADLQADIKRNETNLAIEAFNREIADSQTGLDPFMDGFSTIFGAATPAENGIDTSESSDYLQYQRNLTNQMAFGEDYLPLKASLPDYARTGDACACEIGTGKWLVAYKSSVDSYLYAIVITYSGGAAAYGPSVLVSTENGSSLMAAKIDTDKAVITHWTSGAYYRQYFYVVSVSGTMPLVGGSTYYQGSGDYSSSMYARAMCQLATDKVVIFRQDTNRYGVLQAVTVSGTTPSLGPEQSMGGISSVGSAAMGYVSEDVFAINYEYSNINAVGAYSASGATLTQIGSTLTQYTASVETPAGICPLASDRFVVFSIHNSYKMICYSYEASGGTLTLEGSGEYSYGESALSMSPGGNCSTLKLSDTMAMVAGRAGSNGYLLTTIFNVSETGATVSHFRTCEINETTRASEFAVASKIGENEVVIAGDCTEAGAFGLYRTTDENLEAGVVFNELPLIDTPDSGRVIALVKDIDSAGAIGSDIRVYHALGKTEITGISQTDPCVVTCSAAHGLQDGDLALIVDAGGMAEINGRIVEVVSAGTTDFSCLGLDATGFMPFTSGGHVMAVSLSTLSLQGGFKGDVNVYAGDCTLPAVSGATETRLAVTMATAHGYEFSALAALYK